MERSRTKDNRTTEHDRIVMDNLTRGDSSVPTHSNGHRMDTRDSDNDAFTPISCCCGCLTAILVGLWIGNRL